MKTRDILRKEIIGKECEVIGTGLKGKIINETKNIIEIKTKKDIKKIIKKNNRFNIKYNNEDMIIEGKNINMDPIERVQKIIIGDDK